MKSYADLVQRAKKAIEDEEEFVFDICSDYGQILENVKHMRWVEVEVCKYLVREVKSYQHLKIEKEK